MNFQDVVVLSSNTLAINGEAVTIGGTPGAKTLALANDQFALHITADPPANQTLALPTGNGTLLTNVNISAGTTSNALSAVTFSDSNGVSFGINGSTLTASVASQSNQTLGFYFSSQTTGQSSSSTFDARSVTFRGAGIASVGASAGEVIISVPAGGGALTAINISAGTTSNNLSAFTLSDANGVSFGLDGSTVTASVATSLTNINVSAGTTSNNLSAIVFSDSNNVSFGLNGSTMTASAGAPTLRSYSFPDQPAGSFGSSNAGFSLLPVQIPVIVPATRIAFMAHMTGASNSTGSVLFSLGVYTMSGSTASLASSTVRQFSWTTGTTNSSATSAYGGQSGTRYRTINLGGTWAFTPGNYLFGFWARSSNAGTWTFYGMDQTLSIAGGADAAETQQFLCGFSTSSFSTAMPASINVTDTNYVRTGISAFRQPGYLLMGT